MCTLTGSLDSVSCVLEEPNPFPVDPAWIAYILPVMTLIFIIKQHENRSGTVASNGFFSWDQNNNIILTQWCSFVNVLTCALRSSRLLCSLSSALMSMRRWRWWSSSLQRWDSLIRACSCSTYSSVCWTLKPAIDCYCPTHAQTHAYFQYCKTC